MRQSQILEGVYQYAISLGTEGVKQTVNLVLGDKGQCYRNKDMTAVTLFRIMIIKYS